MKAHVKENKQTIEVGNLYDLNKSMLSQMEPLSDEEWKEKLDLITSFFTQNGLTYAMLLNNELHDYTIFNCKADHSLDYLSKVIYWAEVCLKNRGVVYAIDQDSNNPNALEIWIKHMDDGNMYVYYLFECGSFVIEV